MRQDTRNALAIRTQRHDDMTAFYAGIFGAGAPAAQTGKHDRLASNQSLGKNQAITSNNGRFKFILQNDGNAVVYEGSKALWASNTAGQPITQCIMQSDGNLVLYGANRRAYWASNTAGRGSSVLVMQDDNNLVIYKGGQTPTWSSRGASQHGPFDDIGQFITTAVNAAGKSVDDGLKSIAGGLHDIQKAISNIPGIGGALATLYDLATAPFTTQLYVANSVAHGEALDKALKDNLDRLGKEVSDVLPWVASIISIFPVFGPLVSSIIMTAAALVAGQPIEEVLITAALSAIPGMAIFAHFAAPIIEFGIKVAKAVASKAVDFGNLIVDGLTTIADIVSIQIPDMIKEAIKIGVHMAAALARGMKLESVLLNEAVELLKKYGPQLLGTAYHALGLDAIVSTIGNAVASEAEALAAHIKLAGALTNINFPGFPGPLNDIMRKIFGGSISLGAAAHIQATLSPKVTGIVTDLAKKGADLAIKAAQQGVDAAKNAVAQAPDQLAKLAKDMCVSEARKLLPPQCQTGFDVAVGLMQHTCNPFQMLTIRNSLNADGKKGFDMGSALHVGKVAVKSAPPMPAVHAPPAAPAFNIAKPANYSFGPNLASISLGQLGFFMTAGMGALPVAAKTSIMTTVVTNPSARAGAAIAVTQIADARAADPQSASVVKETWWHRFLAFIGMHPAQIAVSVHATA